MAFAESRPTWHEVDGEIVPAYNSYGNTHERSFISNKEKDAMLRLDHPGMGAETQNDTSVEFDAHAIVEGLKSAAPVMRQRPQNTVGEYYAGRNRVLGGK